MQIDTIVVKPEFLNEDKIIKQLFCQVCTEVFTEPTRLLQPNGKGCLHTFCKSCIHDWIDMQTKKEMEPTCPLCRSQIAPGKLKIKDCVQEDIFA